MIVDEYTLRRLIDQWEPPDRPHCSDCLYAKVSGTPSQPIVRCEKEHGKKILSLPRLIRPSHPIQFRAAKGCPDYSSMGEPTPAKVRP